MSNTRYITLLDGASMNGELIVIRTNAPVELLKELENLSNVAYKNDDDIPLWWREVENTKVMNIKLLVLVGILHHIVRQKSG